MTARMFARGWRLRSLACLLGLVAVSPVFEWAAEQVGYAEPLDNAATLTGATTEAVLLNPGLLPSYSVPGLEPYLGTLVAGFLGTVLTFGLAVAVGRMLN